MNDIKNREIQVIINDKEIFKKYNCEEFSFKYNRTKFFRELRAYKYFNNLEVDFVPRLIGYNQSLCSLTIENVGGNTLRNIIEEGVPNSQEIVSNIIKVDRFLYSRKINYMHSSIDDILVHNDGKKIYIIDFEYTYLNEYFQQILYDCMFGSRMMRVKNRLSRDKFINILHERKNEFQSYYYRKGKNIMLSKLGMLRKKD
jgi:tRNA A-37 threonylcarbamoyl transferase component Bud32